MLLAACDHGLWTRGIVVAPSGEAIGGAAISVHDSGRDKLVLRSGSTGAGCFEIDAVFSGPTRDYRLTVEKRGYRSVSVEYVYGAELIVTLMLISDDATSGICLVDQVREEIFNNCFP